MEQTVQTPHGAITCKITCRNSNGDLVNRDGSPLKAEPQAPARQESPADEFCEKMGEVMGEKIFNAHVKPCVDQKKAQAQQETSNTRRITPEMASIQQCIQEMKSSGKAKKDCDAFSTGGRCKNKPSYRVRIAPEPLCD